MAGTATTSRYNTYIGITEVYTPVYLSIRARGEPAIAPSHKLAGPSGSNQGGWLFFIKNPRFVKIIRGAV